MSEDRAIIDLHVNVGQRKLRTSDGNERREKVYMYRGDQALIRWCLYEGDGTTVFVPPASATWFFGIDNVYTRDHDDLVTSNNAQFNIAADWSEVDVSAGKICCRVNLNTTELKAALADADDAVMYADLSYQPSGGDWVRVAHFDVTIVGYAADPTTSEATEAPTYITADALAAIIEQFTDPDDSIKKVRIKNSDGFTVWVGPPI